MNLVVLMIFAGSACLAVASMAVTALRYVEAARSIAKRLDAAERLAARPAPKAKGRAGQRWAREGRRVTVPVSRSGMLKPLRRAKPPKRRDFSCSQTLLPHGQAAD